MTKNEISKVIKERVENLELLSKQILKKIENYPETNLSCRMVDSCNRYFEIDASTQKYLGVSEIDRIKQLEEKLYFKKLLKTAADEKAALEKIVQKLEKLESTDEVFVKIPYEKRHLIEPYVFIKDDKIIKRFETPDQDGRLTRSSYTTLNGEKVRSKSEVIIADRFKHFGVLYCYEPPTKMCEDFNEIWHPDFLCLNKRTGETYYWEHFGKMDDPQYLDGFHTRMERYAEAGIILGKNLIVTTETSKHPLNTEYLDLLINKYLQ